MVYVSNNRTTFNEVAGPSTQPQARDLTRFATMWFNDDDLVIMAVKLHRKGGMYRHVLVNGANMKTAEDQELYGMIYQTQKTPSGESFPILNSVTNDAYFTVNPVLEDKGPYKRGGKSNVACVVGLYADLDVKVGSFLSQAQALKFLEDLPLPPSAVVDSGSGGLHAYWKLEERLGVVEGEELQKTFTAWLQSLTEVSIDALSDASRILRLPGSVRTSEGQASNVALLSCRGLSYSVADITTATQEVHRQIVHTQAVQRREATQRVQATNDYYEAARSTHSDSEGTDTLGTRLLGAATLEDRINATVGWDQILGPAGWTHTATHSDGTEVWQRPQATAETSKRSATVNWPGSDGHAMSLLSGAPETMLGDLKDASENLSKTRVLLRLRYLDDYKAMVNDVLSGAFD